VLLYVEYWFCSSNQVSENETLYLQGPFRLALLLLEGHLLGCHIWSCLMCISCYGSRIYGAGTCRHNYLDLPLFRDLHTVQSTSVIDVALTSSQI
jgi:hypothetical protein